MTRKRTLIPVLMVLTALGVAPFARADESQNIPPSLSVQGSGQVRADPDEANVRLGVIAQAKSARAAQEQANRVASGILAGLKGLGIEAKDVQTSQLDLSPLYARQQPSQEQENAEPRIAGYQASYTLSVHLTRIDTVGQVIDAGLAAGANQVQGVDFGLREDQAARGRALAEAVGEAKAKAQAIAGALGVRLGEVLEVSEGNVAVFNPGFGKRVAMEAMAASSSTPVSAGQLSIDASVTVRYRISQ